VLDAKFLKVLYDLAPQDYAPRLKSYMASILGLKQLKGESLVNILSTLPGRRCKLYRDRVYSVLSLASEGPNITVDYGSSDLAVYLQILEAYEKTLCFCSAGLIARNLAFKYLRHATFGEDITRPVMYTYVSHQKFRRKPESKCYRGPPTYVCA
jgi:hypothetical protein